MGLSRIEGEHLTIGQHDVGIDHRQVQPIRRSRTVKRPEMTTSQPQTMRLVSIQTKLMWLVVASLAVALSIAAAASMWHEADRYLRAKQETMLATGYIFAAAVSSSTAHGDEAGAAQALRGITRIPSLLYADVTNQDGKQLASIGNAVRLMSDVDIGDMTEGSSQWRFLWADTVAVKAPIIDGGRQVGTLSLVAESNLRAQIWTVLGYALAGASIALVPGLLLARRLQRSITRPLHQLASAMDDVGHTGLYRQIAVDAPDEETALLADSFNLMIGQIGTANAELLARENEIIQRLSRAGEMRDDQTGQHVARVAQISRIVAEELGLDARFVDDLTRASPMHDVGKISISDTILHKPGKLDPDERKEMETHALRGFEILSGSESELVQLAAEIALSHHERWDGTGYPNRIAGEKIPISGRITAVADVCDALFSVRPYKTPWPPEQIKQHFIENSGTHFDPQCVEAILARWVQVNAIYRTV